MNDDSNAPPPADPLSSSNIEASIPQIVREDGDSPQLRARTRLREIAALQRKKKVEFVDSIMLNLDLLVYVELCVLYYMDNSFFRLMLRILAQLMFLTPKPSILPPTPTKIPYIGTILLPNVFCMILHLYNAIPSAHETSRGYMHGTVIIDFIGQKGCSSKLQLLAMDLLIMALQAAMLAVHVEKEGLELLIKGPEAVTAPPSVATLNAIAGQDMDAEERGEMRTVVRDGRDGMEMQALARTPNDEDNTQNGTLRERLVGEQERLLSSQIGDDMEPNIGPLDVFYSGNAIVADFHILHTVRNQWDARDAASATALQTVGHSAGYSWTNVQRRLARLDSIGN